MPTDSTPINLSAMRESLVQGNRVPMYRQLAGTLRQRIRKGDFGPGQALPPIRSIATQYGVSVNVVQRAIRELESDGLLVSQHGKQVRVSDPSAASRAAILFGMIHPFADTTPFGRDVLCFASQAFGRHHNLLVSVSSEASPARERQMAEHLVDNGVQGLLVWPVQGDGNAAYFEQLSRRVPVVLVDRIMKQSSLPAVVHDTLAAGQDIGDHFLAERGCRRLLVVLDDLNISPYRNVTRGLRQSAQGLGRFTDLTIVQLPVTATLEQISHGDFSQVDSSAHYIESLVREGGYDALFCYQDDYLDHVLLDTGVIGRLPGLALGCTRLVGSSARSRRFIEARPTGWAIDHTQAIALAVEHLQQWVLSRKPMQGVQRIVLKRT